MIKISARFNLPGLLDEIIYSVTICIINFFS